MSVFLFTRVLLMSCQKYAPAIHTSQVQWEMVYILSTSQLTALVSLGKLHNQIIDLFSNASTKLC